MVKGGRMYEDSIYYHQGEVNSIQEKLSSLMRTKLADNPAAVSGELIIMHETNL